MFFFIYEHRQQVITCAEFKFDIRFIIRHRIIQDFKIYDFLEIFPNFVYFVRFSSFQRKYILTMNIFQFCEQFSSTAHAIAYMRNRGLLCQIPPICGRNGCPRHMTQVKNPSFPTDGCQWRCPTHKGNKQSIRAGSFFERAHFEFRKGIMLAYFWALSMSSSYVLYDI